MVLRSISLFSGAMGLDLGLEKAGISPAICVELNPCACRTIRRNRPEITLIEGDLTKISTEQILEAAGFQVGEAFIVVGGPPCQSFSTAGKRLAFEDPRGQLIPEFMRVVRESRPRYFIMENVRGILSASLKHRPLNQRGSDFPPLSPEEQPGSVKDLILRDFEAMGYTVNFQLINAANYGVPQSRERVVLIGSRDGHLVPFPEETHQKNTHPGNKLPWVTLKEALTDLPDTPPLFQKYSEQRLKYLRLVPSGGNWRSLPKDLQEEAMGGAFRSGGGKVGFFRRLSWDKPSPTVTTSPHQKATDMCHPDYDRPLSVQEYALIQRFPADWEFEGGVVDQYKQIGNAVPVGVGYVIGKTIVEHFEQIHFAQQNDHEISQYNVQLETGK